jgi:hypothetical protein
MVYRSLIGKIPLSFALPARGRHIDVRPNWKEQPPRESLTGMLTIYAPAMEIRARSMQPNMKQMEGMGDTKQSTTASATGTITAVNGQSQDHLRPWPNPRDQMAGHENGISGCVVSRSFEVQSGR